MTEQNPVSSSEDSASVLASNNLGKHDLPRRALILPVTNEQVGALERAWKAVVKQETRDT